jgi:hypothetical protein
MEDMQEVKQADFDELGLGKIINLTQLNNKNVKLYYTDQNNVYRCFVLSNNNTVMLITTNSKEKTLKWISEDIKKYV